MYPSSNPMSHSPKNFRPEVERLESRNAPTVGPISGPTSAFGFHDVHKQVEQTLVSTPAIIDSHTNVVDDAMLRSVAIDSSSNMARTVKRLTTGSTTFVGELPRPPLGSRFSRAGLAWYYGAGIAERTAIVRLSPNEQAFVDQLEEYAKSRNINLTDASARIYTDVGID